jgi:uncharacterized coiled-coil DUF342 family protein
MPTIKELKAKIAKLKTENKTLKEENEALKEESKALKEEIRSWKKEISQTRIERDSFQENYMEALQILKLSQMSPEEKENYLLTQKRAWEAFVSDFRSELYHGLRKEL